MCGGHSPSDDSSSSRSFPGPRRSVALRLGSRTRHQRSVSIIFTVSEYLPTSADGRELTALGDATRRTFSSDSSTAPWRFWRARTPLVSRPAILQHLRLCQAGASRDDQAVWHSPVVRLDPAAIEGLRSTSRSSGPMRSPHSRRRRRHNVPRRRMTIVTMRSVAPVIQDDYSERERRTRLRRVHRRLRQLVAALAQYLPVADGEGR